MNEEIEKIMHDIWNKEAKKHFETTLNYMLKKKVELPNDKDYLKIYEEIHKNDKTDEEIIEQLEQENKQLKDGLHKILDLNKRAINCDSQKVTIKYLLKQYDLIYETLGELQPGLMKGNKENDI